MQEQLPLEEKLNLQNFMVSWRTISQEKITDSHFWIFQGILRIPSKILNLEERDKSQPGNLVGNSLVGNCLTLPNLGFLWVFFKYPKISNIGNLLFFPVIPPDLARDLDLRNLCECFWR